MRNRTVRDFAPQLRPDSSLDVWRLVDKTLVEQPQGHGIGAPGARPKIASASLPPAGAATRFSEVTREKSEPGWNNTLVLPACRLRYLPLSLSGTVSYASQTLYFWAVAVPLLLSLLTLVMTRLRSDVVRLWKDDHGQDLIEYGLIAGIIAAVGVVVFPLIAGKLGGAFDTWGTQVWNEWEPLDPAPPPP